MVYQLVEDEKVHHLKSKIESSFQNIFPTNLIRLKHIKTQSFKINQVNPLTLKYINPDNNGSFNIAVIMTYADWDARHNVSCRDCRRFQHQNSLMIGFSVGDLIKYFLYMNDHLSFREQFPHLTDQNLYERMNSCFKKVFKMELSGNGHDILGTMSYEMTNIHLWTNLIEQKLVNRKYEEFNNYVNQVVYLPSEMVYKMLKIRNTDGEHYAQINNEQVMKFLGSISNRDLIVNIMRYYIYNEVAPYYEQVTYTFEYPLNVPEILEKICGLEKNDKSCTYMYYRDLLRKKLSPAHQLALDETYSDTIFTKIKDVPHFYPFFAYRKVYLLQWTINDIYDIEYKYRNTIYCQKHAKLRHRIGKSGKCVIIPYDEDYSRYQDSWIRKINAHKHLEDKRETVSDIAQDLADSYDPVDSQDFDE